MKSFATDLSSNRKLAYSLAAGAAVGGLATEAGAQVIYSGEQNIEITQYGSQNLNLDGDAYSDILLKNYVFSGGNYQGAYVNFAPGKVVGFSSGFGYATALSAGALIDSTTTSGGPFQASLAYGGANPSAQFNNVTDAYIGLAFPIGGVNHYGWISVDIDNTAGTFTINEWAYNSVAGQGIYAGTLTAVPEPSTLALLTAGAVGIAAMRRRRKLQPETETVA